MHIQTRALASWGTGHTPLQYPNILKMSPPNIGIKVIQKTALLRAASLKQFVFYFIRTKTIPGVVSTIVLGLEVRKQTLRGMGNRLKHNAEQQILRHIG